MFHKAYFSTTTPRREMLSFMRKEGFKPKLIKDPPGFVYEPHKHPETKFLVCLTGGMKVTVSGKVFQFEPGDILKIPGNTTHSAVVDKKGCNFYWSEK
jgi:quercetin dioxygenase-like cupin family protein